jgi:hypothetical protein
MGSAVQALFDVDEVGCSHVSGLFAQHVAAGLDEVRGPAPSIALIGAIAPWVSPVPGLARFVIISQHPAHPIAGFRIGGRDLYSSRLCPICLVPYQHGPYDARHLLRERHCGDLRPLALEQADEPTEATASLARRPDHRGGSDHQQASHIAVALFGDPGLPFSSTAALGARRETKAGCELTAGS